MATEIGLGLKVIDYGDLVKDGDNIISENARATKEAFEDYDSRISQIEVATGTDDGSLSVIDSAVAPLVRDKDTSVGYELDQEFVSHTELTTRGSSVDKYLSGKIATEQSGAAYEQAPDPTKMSGTVGTRLSIPTHVTPAGGQTTHPSVAFAPDGWNGYSYWMAHTPYPGGNDDHEDPNIVASHDGINWVVPSGLTNPIDDATGQPEYNSDVDLQFGPEGKLYLFWRFLDNNQAGSEEKLYFSSSSNGSAWSAKKLVYQSSATTRRLVSPAFHFDGSRWIMWAVDLVPTPNRVVRLTSSTTSPDSTWSTPTICNIGTMQSGKEPWHISVIRHGGRYVALLNDCTLDMSGTNGDLLMLVSSDGVTWTNSGGPIIPRDQPGAHNALYRATLIPSVQEGVVGYRVWYSAWQTTSPSVWNIYRTWVSDRSASSSAAKATAYGERNPTSDVAANSGLSIAVTFPSGRFTTPPYVTVGTDNTRLNVGLSAVTATGFNFLLTNWTGASVNTSAKLYWSATEK